MRSGSFKNAVYKMCSEIILYKGFGIKWPTMVDMPLKSIKMNFHFRKQVAQS